MAPSSAPSPDEQGGLAGRVLEYCRVTKQLVDDAASPGFGPDRLGALAAFVATEEFERVGPFKDRMDWADYARFLAGWMPNADWDYTFRRVTEAGDLVFLELEEHVGAGGGAGSVHSASVYEFDDAGLIRHLDVYLQTPLPGGGTTS